MAVDTPVRISGGLIAGSILTEVQPIIRPEILCQRIPVSGIMHVIIGRDGRVREITSLGGPPLIQPAIVAAVAQWTYRPYLLNGKPVEVDTTVTVHLSFGSVPTCAEVAAGKPNVAVVSAASGVAVADVPVKVPGGVMAGTILTKGQPIYPPIARGSKVTGATILHVILGPDGHVREIAPIAGPELLRAAAMAIVSQWTYRPYVLNGRAVSVDTTVTLSIDFGGSD